MRECGASVYSASDSAAKEFGEAVPLSARGAASLARRLLDPLGAFLRGNQPVSCTCRVDGVAVAHRLQTR